MRREDDVLVLELLNRCRGAARPRSARRHRPASTAAVALSRGRDGEPRQGLAGRRRRRASSLEGVARAGEEFVGMRRVDGDRQLQPAAVVERRVGQDHRGQEPGQRRSFPWDVHVLRIEDADDADGAVRLRSAAAALAPDCMCAAERTRDRRRAPARKTTSLPADVQAGEVVVLTLGDRQPVARRRPARPRTSGRDRRRAR